MGPLGGSLEFCAQLAVRVSAIDLEASGATKAGTSKSLRMTSFLPDQALDPPDAKRLPVRCGYGTWGKRRVKVGTK